MNFVKMFLFHIAKTTIPWWWNILVFNKMELKHILTKCILWYSICILQLGYTSLPFVTRSPEMLTNVSTSSSILQLCDSFIFFVPTQQKSCKVYLLTSPFLFDHWLAYNNFWTAQWMLIRYNDNAFQKFFSTFKFFSEAE